MQVCIFGIGALGGMIAAKLSLADIDVWLYDIEPTIEALRKNGLSYIEEDGSSHLLSQLQLIAPETAVPHFDYIILAVKAHQIPASLRDLKKFISPDSALVTIQNGIPWWYFQRDEGDLDGHILQSVDPGGEITSAIDVRQVIGCVAYPAAESPVPGTIRHVEGNKLTLGELDGSKSLRCKQLSEVLRHAGFRTKVIADIRSAIWLKALGNLSFNPVSALTRMTMQQICEFEPTRNLVTEMMYEAEHVAKSLGNTLRVSVEQRVAGAGRVGHHKTSMLQDLEAGRSLEIDALLGSIVEIAALKNIPAPNLERIYALVKALNMSTQSEQPLAL